MANGGATQRNLIVDPRDGTIAGPAGSARLEPKVMAVLRILARSPGEVVSRDEFLGEVWAGVVVTEHTLSRCIYQLRTRFRELAGALDPAAYVAIETLTKRGYRLRVAPGVALLIRDEGERESVQSLGTVQTLGEHSIAVLPFTDMSAEGDHTYFGDGFAEELINGLSRLKSLRVIARTSSFQFRGPQDVLSVGRKLNVATVLEGSIRRSGNRIRLMAQLIDTRSNTHIWSERYDRELGDLFDVQDEVANRVINALRMEFSPAGHKVIDVGTSNVDAYNSYLLGLSESRRYTARSMAAAAELFERALQHDPEFAAAYGELGMCYLSTLFASADAFAGRREEAVKALSEARNRGWEHPALPWIQIERLLELPSLPDARRLAEADLAKIREPDPAWRHFEYLHLSMLLARAGLLDAAIDFFYLHREKAEYPSSALYIFGLPSDVITLLSARGRYEDAIDEASLRIEEEPQAYLVRGERAMLYSRIGATAEAEADLAAIAHVWPRSFAQVYHLYWSGRQAEAREQLAWMTGRRNLHPISALCGSLMIGDAEQAIHHLTVLADRRDPTALYVRPQVARYAEPAVIEQVARDPRYLRALEQLGIPDAWRDELVDLVNGVAGITGIRVAQDR